MSNNLKEEIDSFLNIATWLSNNLEKLFEYSEELKGYSIEDYKSWDIFDNGVSIEYINQETGDECIVLIEKEKIYEAIKKDILKNNIKSF